MSTGARFAQPRHAKASGRKRPKKHAFRSCHVEPFHALVPSQYGHLAIVVCHDIVVGRCCQDRIRLRPLTRCRPPDAREIEPVATRQCEAVVLALAAMAEFGGWHEATMRREGSPFGTNDRKGSTTGLAGLKAPRQLDHLNIAAVAPYDYSAFVERRFGIESFRAHDERT